MGSYIGLAVLLGIWSSAFAAIRVGLSAYGPGELALLRFLTASAVLAAAAVARRTRLPRARDLPLILLLGVLGITGYHLALNFGEVTVSAGTASLLIGAAPLFTAALAVPVLGERMRPIGWLGIAVGFVGVALIAFGEGGGVRMEAGAVIVVLAAISTSAYNVLQKRVMTRYAPLEFTTYVIWAGTIPMLVFLPGLLRDVGRAPVAATVSALYLGVFPAAIGYILWVRALSRFSASTLASVLYLNPVLAMLIAWAWLGEIPTGLTVLGGVVAIAGAALASWIGRDAVRQMT
ncbi:MAG: DMT family transporter [Candidatus Bipolaricaulia bacterium]